MSSHRFSKSNESYFDEHPEISALRDAISKALGKVTGENVFESLEYLEAENVQRAALHRIKLDISVTLLASAMRRLPVPIVDEVYRQACAECLKVADILIDSWDRTPVEILGQIPEGGRYEY